MAYVLEYALRAGKHLFYEFLLGGLPICFFWCLILDAFGRFRRDAEGIHLRFLKNFAVFSLPLLFSHIFYFLMKGWSNIRGASPFLMGIELPLWREVCRILPHIPHQAVSLLDLFYEKGWRWSVEISWLIFLASREAGIWIPAICVAYVAGGIMHFLLPSLPPLYAHPACFSSILRFAPLTSTFSGESAVCMSVLRSGGSISSIPGEAVLYPISSFPSLHITFSLLLALFLQERVPCLLGKVAVWLYFGLVVTGSIFLGHHYILDDVAGAALAFPVIWLKNRTCEEV